jgi:hypothetical protein
MLGFVALFAMMKGLHAVNFLHISSVAICIVAVIALAITMACCKRIKVDLTLSLFIGVCVVSLIFQPQAEYFHAWQRLVFFIVMLGLLSPLLQSRRLGKIRELMWKIMIWGFRIVVGLSFIGYCFCWAGIPFLNNGRLLGFCGVTRVGMTLSAFCAVVIVELLWQCFRAPFKSKRFLICSISAFLTFIMMIHAGSRISILGVLLAFGVMTYYYRDRFREVKKMHIALGGLGVVLFLGVITPFVSATLVRKTQVANEHNSLMYSRKSVWQDRIIEFKSSPIIGVGYTVQTSFTSPLIDQSLLEENRSGEPGSTWLSLLSQVGILGFLLAVWFNVKLICRMLKLQRDNVALYLSMSIFLFVNSLVEGWLLYPGGHMSYVFWLLSGCVYSKNLVKA